MGAVLDIVADAGGVPISLFRAFHTHVNGDIYIQRISNNDVNINAKAYYKSSGNGNVFYVSLNAWGCIQFLNIYPFTAVEYSIEEVPDFNKDEFVEV